MFYCNEKPIEYKNLLSITTNGVNAFTCKYQNKNACYSTDSEILFNDKMNKYSAMFIITLLNLENYRYAYMRKPKGNKIPLTQIILPIDDDGNPNWEFMENYIKSLPYSKYL